jgi:hypothetical protein
MIIEISYCCTRLINPPPLGKWVGIEVPADPLYQHLMKPCETRNAPLIRPLIVPKEAFGMGRSERVANHAIFATMLNAVERGPSTSSHTSGGSISSSIEVNHVPRDSDGLARSGGLRLFPPGRQTPSRRPRDSYFHVALFCRLGRCRKTDRRQINWYRGSPEPRAVKLLSDRRFDQAFHQLSASPDRICGQFLIFVLQ